MSIAKTAKVVKVHFTGKLENGEIFDSSRGREPLQFTLGANEVIPGLDQGVKNMKVGEKKSIVLTPSNGFGPRKPELVRKIPFNKFPKDHIPAIGQFFKLKTPNGQKKDVKVINVDRDNITIDANHPLAGKVVIFDLELLEVR